MAHEVNDANLHTSGTYETDQGGVGDIVKYGIALAITTVVVFVIVFFIFRFLETHTDLGPPVNALSNPGSLPPEPRLEVNPWESYRALRLSEDQRLQTYGWVDQKGGAVRIPIDQAMQAVLQRGLPIRGTNTAPAPAAPVKKKAAPSVPPTQ